MKSFLIDQDLEVRQLVHTIDHFYRGMIVLILHKLGDRDIYLLMAKLHILLQQTVKFVIRSHHSAVMANEWHSRLVLDNFEKDVIVPWDLKGVTQFVVNW
jgi:hypothetical protein